MPAAYWRSLPDPGRPYYPAATSFSEADYASPYVVRWRCLADATSVNPLRFAEPARFLAVDRPALAELLPAFLLKLRRKASVRLMTFAVFRGASSGNGLRCIFASMSSRNAAS